MILRKPYAFFIKNFKLIHVILTLLSSYLMYKTTILIVYINEFMASGAITANANTASQLFNFLIFLVPFLIILISILVLSVLYLKKKPLLFYTLNILTYIAVIVIYNFVYKTILQMETMVLHARTIRLARDFLLMIFVAELVTTIRAFIYSTGFDIKKFNFGQDLAELEADEEDREEFEVGIEIDVNKAHRQVRRRYRFSRYVYVENKFLIDVGILITLAITLFLIYFNTNIYNKTYQEGDAFTTMDYSMRLNKSYITSKNYKGVEVTPEGKTLLVLEIELKKHSIMKKVLDEARVQLVIGKQKYYHKNIYRDGMVDLGKSYENDAIPLDFIRYILVYEIPNKDKKKKITFKYLDDINYLKGELRPKYINVKLKPSDITKTKSNKKYKLGEKIKFKNSILNETTMQIDDYEIADKFKIDYNYCVSSIECYKSHEYVKSDIFNPTKKTLLKITGSIEWDNKLAINPINRVYNFLNMFGSIEYEKDGVTNKQEIIIGEVKPLKLKKTNVYYIEVNDDIKNAGKIKLIINVRNFKYTYELK